MQVRISGIIVFPSRILQNIEKYEPDSDIPAFSGKKQVKSREGRQKFWIMGSLNNFFFPYQKEKKKLFH